MECITCQAPNPDDLVYETKHWRIVLAPDQSYLGRCYVTLKKHCGDLAELEREEWLDFAELVKKLEGALKKSFNATLFNWTCLLNGAYQNNPPNPHVHWHFRPRYKHRVEFAGLLFEDKEFGHHYSRETNHEVPKDIREGIIERIRENL